MGKVVIPFRKSSSNGMIYIMQDREKVLYSPYLEYETLLPGSEVLVKVVAKMGNDGINPNLDAPLASGVTLKDKPLYRELTLFVINQGPATVQITPKYLEVEEDTISKLEDSPQLIGAGEYHECEPHMAKDRRDRLSLNTKVVVEFNKEMLEIHAPLRRLSVKELDDKYGKKDDNASK